MLRSRDGAWRVEIDTSGLEDGSDGAVVCVFHDGVSVAETATIQEGMAVLPDDLPIEYDDSES